MRLDAAGPAIPARRSRRNLAAGAEALQPAHRAGDADPLARLAVERAALDLMQLVQRSVGFQAFLRPNPIERISRDLATYLRQPGPDRALANTAAWVLAQPQGAQDLWR